ncbi:hypothetical protein ECC02_009343 [Trypanosoma cruzi]|uniref:Uncharacterized protein n=1 Tax=Trypanosoma cruzi TaxID=5693 RepID=A0A7J6XUT5_TRYCR|nr:hypothetical protein ECC02_009343 [Trypanosoma cruzi]
MFFFFFLIVCLCACVCVCVMCDGILSAHLCGSTGTLGFLTQWIEEIKQYEWLKKYIGRWILGLRGNFISCFLLLFFFFLLLLFVCLYVFFCFSSFCGNNTWSETAHVDIHKHTEAHTHLCGCINTYMYICIFEDIHWLLVGFLFFFFFLLVCFVCPAPLLFLCAFMSGVFISASDNFCCFCCCFLFFSLAHENARVSCNFSLFSLLFPFPFPFFFFFLLLFAFVFLEGREGVKIYLPVRLPFPFLSDVSGCSWACIYVCSTSCVFASLCERMGGRVDDAVVRVLWFIPLVMRTCTFIWIDASASLFVVVVFVFLLCGMCVFACCCAAALAQYEEERHTRQVHPFPPTAVKREKGA